MSPLLDSRANVAIIVTATPIYAHVEKLLPVAQSLSERGYPVTFITGEEFRENVATTAIEFQELIGVPKVPTEEDIKTAASLPSAEAADYLISSFVVGRLDEQQFTLQHVLGKLKQKYTDVVYIHDLGTLGLLPQQMGCPGLLPTVSMSFGVVPITLDSRDTFPYPSNKSPYLGSGREAVHQAAYKESDPSKTRLDSALATKLSQLGVSKPHVGFWNSMAVKDDYLLQLGLPEFEYERTDIAPELVFLGVPQKFATGDHALPSWWPDLSLAKNEGKSIVVVSQGSTLIDLNNLLAPTLKALRDRQDLLVVATTVVAEPEEVSGLEVPHNARVARFIPFDQLLPHADLIITAGGYGTVLQAIAHGVPMVHAGVAWDKIHVGTLSELKGIAVDLTTEAPSIEQIVHGVSTILGDGHQQRPAMQYRESIQAMAAKLKDYSTFDIIDETISKALARKRLDVSNQP